MYNLRFGYDEDRQEAEDGAGRLCYLLVRASGGIRPGRSQGSPVLDNDLPYLLVRLPRVIPVWQDVFITDESGSHETPRVVSPPILLPNRVPDGLHKGFSGELDGVREHVAEHAVRLKTFLLEGKHVVYSPCSSQGELLVGKHRERNPTLVIWPMEVDKQVVICRGQMLRNGHNVVESADRLSVVALEFQILGDHALEFLSQLTLAISLTAAQEHRCNMSHCSLWTPCFE